MKKINYDSSPSVLFVLVTSLDARERTSEAKNRLGVRGRIARGLRGVRGFVHVHSHHQPPLPPPSPPRRAHVPLIVSSAKKRRLFISFYKRTYSSLRFGRKHTQNMPSRQRLSFNDGETGAGQAALAGVTDARGVDEWNKYLRGAKVPVSSPSSFSPAACRVGASPSGSHFRPHPNRPQPKTSLSRSPTSSTPPTKSSSATSGGGGGGGGVGAAVAGSRSTGASLKTSESPGTLTHRDHHRHPPDHRHRGGLVEDGREERGGTTPPPPPPQHDAVTPERVGIFGGVGFRSRGGGGSAGGVTVVGSRDTLDVSPGGQTHVLMLSHSPALLRGRRPSSRVEDEQEHDHDHDRRRNGEEGYAAVDVGGFGGHAIVGQGEAEGAGEGFTRYSARENHQVAGRGRGRAFVFFPWAFSLNFPSTSYSHASSQKKRAAAAAAESHLLRHERGLAELASVGAAAG